VSFDFLRARFPSRLSQERQAQRLAFTINGVLMAASLLN
jgi:hypothetical protein